MHSMHASLNWRKPNERQFVRNSMPELSRLARLAPSTVKRLLPGSGANTPFDSYVDEMPIAADAPRRKSLEARRREGQRSSAARPIADEAAAMFAASLRDGALFAAACVARRS